jgi:geranylgeranyl pyrophosphate synthase
MDEALYLEIVHKKTASLFSACGKLGAVVAGGTEKQIAALGAYGENLGIAFQIQDDLLDLIGEQEVLGKPVYLDLEQGTPSLAVLYALGHAVDAIEILRAGNRAQVIHMLQESGALNYAADQAHMFANRALAALSGLPESGASNELRRLAHHAVARHQ